MQSLKKKLKENMYRPAADQRVGSQSAIEMSWFETLLGFLIRGLQMAAAPLTPPSHGLFLIFDRKQKERKKVYKSPYQEYREASLILTPRSG